MSGKASVSKESDWLNRHKVIPRNYQVLLFKKQKPKLINMKIYYTLLRFKIISLVALNLLQTIFIVPQLPNIFSYWIAVANFIRKLTSHEFLLFNT